MMHRLVIDKDLCTHCGTCEAIIPGLVAGIEDNGPLQFLEPHPAVNRAINSCRQQALELKEVEDV